MCEGYRSYRSHQGKHVGKSYIVQIAPRKHYLDTADHTDPTEKHNSLDLTDDTDPTPENLNVVQKW